MEENKLGQNFWNFLTKPKSEASYEETEVEGGINTRLDNDFEAYKQESSEVGDGMDFEGALVADEETVIDQLNNNESIKEADYSFIEVPQEIAAYSYTSVQTGYPYNNIEVPDHHHDVHMAAAYSCRAQPLPLLYSKYSTDQDHSAGSEKAVDVYEPFVQATNEGRWSDMKEFLMSHPEAFAAPLFDNEGTALHQTLNWGTDRDGIAECLVEGMNPEDLEVQNSEGYTPLALATVHHSPEWLLQRMIDKNPNLPNIGHSETVPVVVASWKGFHDTTWFLYRQTHKNFLSYEHKEGRVGVTLLRNCINIKLFAIATELVEKSPEILRQGYKIEDGVFEYPMHTFATTFCALSEKDSLKDKEEARVFLRLVCRYLSKFSIMDLKKCVGDGMIEAAKHGNIEFITEMLRVDRELIRVSRDRKDIFWHAIENRQEKVFNLIYPVGDEKDSITSHVNPENNNILHWAAILPHSSVLDRILSPALQMQRELQWFKAVSDVAKSRYQGNLNKDKFTPRQVFTIEHKDLLKEAETSMKETAKAASTVGALIITTMFAGAFVVTVTANSSFTSQALFNVFIVCDALSLCSSTTAILVFLEILTSSYSEDDFLFRLPRKFMAGFCTLIIAIATMMTAFCSALAISLQDHPLLIIVPFLVLLFVPLMFYNSSIFPLLVTTYYSTYGPSIFDKTTRLPESKRGNIGCCYS